MRCRGGFTLIELIAVVVIIGLMMAVAVARMDFLVPKYRLRAAAREVGATMKQGKSRAASTGKDVYLEIDLAKSEYRLQVAVQKTDPSGAPEPGFVYEPFFEQTLPDGVVFVDVILGEKNKIAEGVARVRMSPFGASAHTIVNLRNTEKRELAVKVNGFTGHLSFYDEYKDADELLDDPDQ